MHSAKGTTWHKKDHAYIRREGNRYIYGKIPLSDKAMRTKSPKNIQPDRGDYLYPKFMYDRDQAKYKQAEIDARVNKQAYQQQLMRMELEDKKKDKPKQEQTSNKLFTGDPTNPFATVFSAIRDFFAPSKNRGDAVPGATKEQLRSLIKEVDDRMRFYSQMQLENTSKYQNSSNYKFQRSFSNFIDKGKAFVKNLFNFRNDKPKPNPDIMTQYKKQQATRRAAENKSVSNMTNVVNNNRAGVLYAPRQAKRLYDERQSRRGAMTVYRTNRTPVVKKQNKKTWRGVKG